MKNERQNPRFHLTRDELMEYLRADILDQAEISDEKRVMIEAHLKACQKCREEYNLGILSEVVPLVLQWERSQPYQGACPADALLQDYVHDRPLPDEQKIGIGRHLLHCPSCERKRFDFTVKAMVHEDIIRMKRRHRLPAFARLPLLVPRSQPVDRKVAASSTGSDITIEKELMELDGKMVAETEQRGAKLIVHLLGSHEEVAGSRVSLCEQGKDRGWEYVSATTDEGGWVVFDLAEVLFAPPWPREEGSQWCLCLEDWTPSLVGESAPLQGSQQIEYRRLARRRERRNRFPNMRLLLQGLQKGDNLDRDDAYDQLQTLMEKCLGEDDLPRFPLISEIRQCLTARTENDPHLMLKRDKVLEVLREVEQKWTTI